MLSPCRPYYDSVRVNLGLFQHDVDVLWDLAVHDLSIMDFVLSRPPRAVAAAGVAHVPSQPVNTAYLTCYFDDDLIAHFHVNWLAPVKIRRTLLGGDRQMIVYDDLEPSEKVKVYDKGITLGNGSGGNEGAYDLLVGYRSGVASSASGCGAISTAKSAAGTASSCSRPTTWSWLRRRCWPATCSCRRWSEP